YAPPPASTSPISVPCPSSAVETAPRAALIFSGWTTLSTSSSFSYRVLNSTVTLSEVISAPALIAWIGASAGVPAGTSRSTYLAPNTVEDWMSACTSAGMCFISPRSMSSSSTAWSPRCLIVRTVPTWTPRILTLALGSITRPARSVTRVIFFGKENPPKNALSVTAISPPMINTRIRADSRRFGCLPKSALIVVSPLSRQVEVAGGAVDRQRQQQRHRHHRDQRGAHRVAHGHAHPGRTARGVVAVVGVHQHDHHRHRDRLQERPEDVHRLQEGREVMIVDARRLTVDDHGGEAAGQERGAHRQRVQRDHRDHAGQHAGGDQVRHRGDGHRLERVDLLGHPHRAELRGRAGADGRRQ